MYERQHVGNGTMIGTCGIQHLEARCYGNNAGLSITTQDRWTSDQAMAG